MKILRQNVGTFLIILSLCFFAVFAFPIIKAYFLTNPVRLTDTPSESFRILIPSINADAPIVSDVDPWDKDAYDEALKEGVAHAQGTGFPGNNRMIYLFAHSSGMPWEQLRYNTVFLRLGDLKEGEIIYLERNKKRYPYKVVAKKEVWPSEVRFLEDASTQYLILQTCTPIGTTLKRLLVFAEPIAE